MTDHATTDANPVRLRFNWRVLALYFGVVVVASAGWEFAKRSVGIGVSPVPGMRASFIASWLLAFVAGAGSPFLFKPLRRPRSWARHITVCAVLCLAGAMVTYWLGVGR
ncbi:MAG TPA: hypothetical protein VGD77_05055 [Gemmatimonadaceae bacterium]